MRLQDRTYLFILNSLFNFLYIEEKKKLYNGEFYYSLNNENNTLSQIYSVSKSISLLGDRYDCVILSRYDNFIYNFPNLNDLNMNNLYLNNSYLHCLVCYVQIFQTCIIINYYYSTI